MNPRMNPSAALRGILDSARRLAMARHNRVGTLAILAALLEAKDATATRVLVKLLQDPDEVRREAMAGDDSHEGPGPGEYTAAAAMALNSAAELARQSGSGEVGSEHLMLALLATPCAARQLLAKYDVHLSLFKDAMVHELVREPAGSGAAGDEAQPWLEDLTELARRGRLKPVIGRDREIERVIRILSRFEKNNPVLIGDAGVGKTAIVEGLAQRIVEGKVPEPIKGFRILVLNVAALVAGTQFRGQFEARMQRLVDELKKDGKTILFIDELHVILGAGAGGHGALDAANILKPALARGEIRVIGATTLNEYRKHVEKDAALKRRFQPVMVEEPKPEDALAILRCLRDRYEAHHQVRIPDEALEAAVRLSHRYITDRFLPDKAIDLIDEAASMARLESEASPSPEVADLLRQLEEVTAAKEAAVAAEDYERAAELKEQQGELQQKLAEARQRVPRPEVTPDHVARVVAEWTGIPVERVASDEAAKLIRLEELLRRRVVGQDEAIKAVADAIRVARTGLKDPRRPIGSFLFLGPTGVGKTETAKALAEALFGDEDAMIVLDMSEYQERHTVSRLIGSPPGYVGYEEGGQLTEAVRRRPYSVVVFDEIEKAHPEVWNLLLQVLDEGRLTDAQGRRVDFRNTVVILTSNLGADRLHQRRVGFGGDARAEVEKEILGELKRAVRPELLNRIDHVIVFRPLDQEALERILDMEIAKIQSRIREAHGVELEVLPELRRQILARGYAPELGARPLKREAERALVQPIARALLEGKIRPGMRVRIGEEGIVEEEGVATLPSSQERGAA